MNSEMYDRLLVTNHPYTPTSFSRSLPVLASFKSSSKANL